MSDKQLVLALAEPRELYRISTDVAGLCKDAVVKTSMKISGKSYVKVEGWQTIAAAHGCVAEIESVQESVIEDVPGLIAWARLKRMSDGAILSRASAFIGDDESQEGVSGKKYARYAKVQTRAISRVCSNAFRFVVVLMNAGLETTPAEEMSKEGFDDAKPVSETRRGVVKETGSKPALNKKKEPTGETLFYGTVGETRVWTKDAELGPVLLTLEKKEVIAQVVPLPTGTNHLINIDLVRPDDDQPDDIPF